MQTSLGISAGNEVVCSALFATTPNGTQTFDYRVVSADAAHSDLGDLVSSSIELMTTQMPRDPVHPIGVHSGLSAPQDRPEAPTTIAVAHRDREQEVAIRAAVGRRRDIQLIPESTAALTFLRYTGLLNRYATVAIIDLGATGMSVTVADFAVMDPADHSAHSERSTAISGNAIDELVYHHLLDCHFVRRGTRPNRTALISRSRTAKEHLSLAQAVTIDHVAGQPLKLTRADFEELIADLLREATQFAAGVFGRAPRYPEAVAIVGGGANIPAVASYFGKRLAIPVHTLPEPEAAIAKGAALLAASEPAGSPTGGATSDTSTGTFVKLFGSLAVAVAVVGLVIGYGVQELVPAHRDVNPAGTSNTAQLTTPATNPAPTGTPGPPVGQPRESDRHQSDGAVPPSPTAIGPAPNTPGPATNAPPLRPDPNLPQIPLPDLPHMLGPLLGTSLQTTVPTDTPITAVVPNNPMLPQAGLDSVATNPLLPTD